VKAVKRVIKREVLSSEMVLSLRAKKRKLAAEQLAYTQLNQIQIPQQANPSKQFWRIGSFAAIGLVLVMIIQAAAYLSSAKQMSGQILGEATSAYTDLRAAGQNLSSQNFAAATQLFNSAKDNIQSAQSKLDNYRALTWLVPQANSAKHVLTGAGFLAQAGDQLTQAVQLFDQLKINSQGAESSNFNQIISQNRELLLKTRQLTLLASDEFNSAGSLPLDYANTLDQAKTQVNDLNLILEKLTELEDLYLGLFTGQKTYLLIFQNPDEARATGGFIGTYGVLKVDNGKILQLKIESIYQLDGQIFAQIAAPGPFQPAIVRWGIRDANWFADFPTSARKLLNFFELGSQTADGVISTTPQLFEDLLKLTGPIDMPEYGRTLTSDNFQSTVQFETSVNYDKTLNQPKKFLSDFAPILLDRLTNLKREQFLGLFQSLQDNLQSKQILLFSQNSTTQTKIEKLGFGGQILATDYDYLNIVNSNLGGTKTDLSMEQKVDLQSKFLSDGSVVNILTISRKNSADSSNRDYLRALVPLGSQFVSASGFDDYQYFPSTAKGLKTDPDLKAWDAGFMQANIYTRTETGKTEFAGWLNTIPGQEKIATITYILPFKIQPSQSYSLLLQKQSGILPYEFTGEISLGSRNTVWTSGNIKKSGRILNFESDSNTDDFFAVVLSP
jgi:hypothetical protein